MNLFFFLISAFSKSKLVTPTFIKENNYLLCEIKFDEPINIKGFEILEGKRGKPVKEYERIFLKRSGFSRLIDSIEIDLSDKCSLIKKSSYSICFNLESDNNKIYSVPFIYSSKDKNFIVDESVNSDKKE